jgi:hypothetical protein
VQSIPRTVRFNTDELQLIDEFLKHNPFFDFSTLVRVATAEFIQDPRLQLKAVGTTGQRENTKSSPREQ